MKLPPNAHPHETDYFGKVVPPEGSFKLAVRGLDGEGNPFDRICQKLFYPQPMRMTIIRDPYEVTAGTTTYYSTITNYGEADTFEIKFLNADGFVSRVSHTTLALERNESRIIEIDVSVPQGTPQGKRVKIRGVVTSITNPEASKFAELDVGVKIPLGIVSP
jgi:hypothetical protein